MDTTGNFEQLVDECGQADASGDAAARQTAFHHLATYVRQHAATLAADDVAIDGDEFLSRARGWYADEAPLLVIVQQWNLEVAVCRAYLTELRGTAYRTELRATPRDD